MKTISHWLMLYFKEGVSRSSGFLENLSRAVRVIYCVDRFDVNE